jgi:hypothetical protein
VRKPALQLDHGHAVAVECVNGPQANIDIEIVPHADGSILWVMRNFGELARSMVCPGWNHYLR